MESRKLEGFSLCGEIMRVNGEWWAIEYWLKLKNKWKMGAKHRKWCGDKTEAIEYIKDNKEKWIQSEIYKLNETDKPIMISRVGVSGKWYNKMLSE